AAVRIVTAALAQFRGGRDERYQGPRQRGERAEGTAGAGTVAHRTAAARSQPPTRGRPGPGRGRPWGDTGQSTPIPAKRSSTSSKGRRDYQAEGQPTRTFNAGDALTVPAGVVHVVRNVGSGNAADLAMDGRPVIALDE